MWFYAALATAVISGGYTVYSKHTLKNTDPFVFYWAVMTTSIPFVFIFSYQDGIPNLSYPFFIGIVGSVVFYTISKVIFYHSIKNAVLSHVYPLISIGPVFTLLFSMLFLSERLSGLEIVGGGITLFGTYMLNISSAKEGILEPFKILIRNKFALMMLVSVLIGSVVMIFDKVAVNNMSPQNTSFALLAENLLIAFGLLPYILIKKKSELREIFAHKGNVLALAALNAASNLLAFLALGSGNPGIISSILRTQVFFVLLFSFIFFKDRPKRDTLLASIVMILGLVVLKLAS